MSPDDCGFTSVTKLMPIEKISKYEALWPSGTSDLKIEMACIQQGGKWKKNGRECGMGLVHHYAAMRKILWPHLDDHRWNQLCLKEAVASKVLVLLGAASTGKTHFGAWFGLCYYYCFPNETLVMISSTDLRGLQLRIFGEIKMLHEIAQGMHDVPGNLLETKFAISTDDIEDDQMRDLRKGVIGIPTVNNGLNVGLKKWIGVKQKRILLIADECFPAGTTVDTPSGPMAIETVKAGQQVINASGIGTVIGVSFKKANSLVRIRTMDGREIVCTQNHKVMTQLGWITACKLTRKHYIYAPHETRTTHPVLLPGLQQGIHISNLPQENFLQSSMQEYRRYSKTGSQGEGLFRKLQTEEIISEEAALQGSSGIVGKLQVQIDSGTRVTQRGKTNCGSQEPPQTAVKSNEKRRLANQIGEDYFGCVSGFYSQLRSKNRIQEHKRKCIMLLDRCSISGYSSGNRGGWSNASQQREDHERSEKRRFSCGSWVEDCSVLKQEDFKRYSGGDSTVEVYNLHVESDHTYSVNGLLVHNCQFMNSSFLSAFANLDKNVSFKAIVLGNPCDILDPLGKAAEPKDGWGSHMAPEKTATWDTRFMNGRCINLIGLDSPNFDYPEDQPTKFPYLISKEKITNTKSFFSEDSAEFHSQCIGSMRIGMMLKRVLSRDLCTQFQARDTEVVWDGTPTRIAGLDAAYGGDRCMCGYIEFGKALVPSNSAAPAPTPTPPMQVIGETIRAVPGKDLRVILLYHDPVIVPIRIGTGKEPEEQIAEFVKEFCRNRNIPPENFFHDSTGRGSLGTALARVWSAQCNPVEFGGTPTTRPVSLDLYIWDQALKRRRLKRCDEHYNKFVTELWFTVRYAVEAGQVRGLPEPMIEEFCMREWRKVKADKIEVETKEEMKERVGRSPDEADLGSILAEGARRRGFQVSRLANSESEQKNTQWFQDLAAKATTHTSHELVYR